VNYFTRPLVTTETILRRDPLAEVEKEYRLAERAFIEACRTVAAYNSTHKDLRRANFDEASCVLVSAMTFDPELQRLEAAADRARRGRNELLERRAGLLKDFGKIR